MPPVIVFDLDDTLYLERDFVHSGFQAVDRWLTRERAVHGFFDEAWQQFAAGRRGDVFDHALQALAVTPEPELIGRLVEVYRAHRPCIRLPPEAEELLGRLSRWCQVAVLTDGHLDTQRAKVAALGLDHRCWPVVCTDVWGRRDWKPSARGFLHIQHVLGAAPAACVYIGDNPAKDFRAPKALGWRTLRVRHPRGEHAAAVAASPADQADATVSDLAAIDIGDLLAGHGPTRSPSKQSSAEQERGSAP